MSWRFEFLDFIYYLFLKFYLLFIIGGFWLGFWVGGVGVSTLASSEERRKCCQTVSRSSDLRSGFGFQDPGSGIRVPDLGSSLLLYHSPAYS